MGSEKFGKRCFHISGKTRVNEDEEQYVWSLKETVTDIRAARKTINRL